MARKAKKDAVDLIKHYEILRFNAEEDPETGKFTVGWGHVGDEVNQNSSMTIQQADDQLGVDLGLVENYLDQAITSPISSEVFDAICVVVWEFRSSMADDAWVKQLIHFVNRENWCPMLHLIRVSGLALRKKNLLRGFHAYTMARGKDWKDQNLKLNKVKVLP